MYLEIKADEDGVQVMANAIDCLLKTKGLAGLETAHLIKMSIIQMEASTPPPQPPVPQKNKEEEPQPQKPAKTTRSSTSKTSRSKSTKK